MVELVPVTGGQTLRQIKKLYREAFPRCERKPFAVIWEKSRKGQMELLAIDSEGFAGLVITVLYGDIVLLDYFAVSPERRGDGIGSAVMALLQSRYAGKRLLLEIEDPDVPCDNREERERRRRFYLRNGLTVMPYGITLFGVPMRVLTRGGAVSFAEYHAVYACTFSPLLAQNVRER